MPAPRPVARGFTLVELMAVVLIIGALVALLVPRIRGAQDRARVTKAIGDIRALQIDLATMDTLPVSLAEIGRAGLLDPWDNPYQYLKFPDNSKGPPQGARRDRFLVPLNSSYDLYSMGKDGESRLPLGAKQSLDDIVRAFDGGFVGLASTF